MQQQLLKGIFHLDEGGKTPTLYKGYYFENDLWNGFFQPYMTKEEIEKLATNPETFEHDNTLTFIGETLAILNYDCYDEVKPLNLSYNGKALTLYPMGNGWAWQRI